jgi:hypothetical protein
MSDSPGKHELPKLAEILLNQFIRFYVSEAGLVGGWYNVCKAVAFASVKAGLEPGEVVEAMQRNIHARPNTPGHPTPYSREKRLKKCLKLAYRDGGRSWFVPGEFAKILPDSLRDVFLLNYREWENDGFARVIDAVGKSTATGGTNYISDAMATFEESLAEDDRV